MDPFAMLLAVVLLLIIGFPIGKALVVVGIIGCVLAALFVLILDKKQKLGALVIFGIPSAIALCVGFANENLMLFELFF